MTDNKVSFDTVIVGLGKTGLSCARYLQRQGGSFAVTDNRDLPPELVQFKQEFPQASLAAGRFDETLILNAGEILLSPGVPLEEPVIEKAIAKGIPVSGDVEIFCREAQAPIVAITGSNGKSTVASLLYEMAIQAGMKVQLGGNIGTPVLDLLKEATPDLYVLELSSFQLELTRSLNATASVVLNVTEDHMDRYASLEDYAAAKSGIYAGNGCMIINLDDAHVTGMLDPGRRHICFTRAEPDSDQFGLKEMNGSVWLMQGSTRLLDSNELKIRGRHNYLNALAALALGQAIALPMDAMLKALRKFRGLPHRCEFVRSINGVDWYNDSKGTNVGASCAAIESLAGHSNVILIVGGEGKDADFSPLLASVTGRVKLAITIGRDGPVIRELLQDSVKVVPAASMEEAVMLAHQQADAGDVVLLSPACASLDMFTDYADRGRCFEKVVNLLEVTE